jgi:beta-lactamase class A
VETALEHGTRRAAQQPSVSGQQSPALAQVERLLEPPALVQAWDDPILRRAIEDALGPDLEHTSVVVRRLSDGRSASVNGEREYYAASTFKLAILYEAERRRSLGELNLDDVIYFNVDDLSEDLGTLDYLSFEADGGVRIQAALEAMVTYSDNSSAVALLHLLGGDAIDETLRTLGLTAMSVNTRDLPTTATDLALLMQAIAEGRGLSEEARDEARSFLMGQKTRDGIPAGLPWDMRVGNKTGTWEGATHDVAFVEAPGGTYVIAILSDKGWAWDPLQRVSGAVIDQMWTR